MTSAEIASVWQVMLPMPSELCFTIEGGDQWALRFGRDGQSGKVTSATADGLGNYPVVLKKLP